MKQLLRKLQSHEGEQKYGEGRKVRERGAVSTEVRSEGIE